MFWFWVTLIRNMINIIMIQLLYDCSYSLTFTFSFSKVVYMGCRSAMTKAVNSWYRSVKRVLKGVLLLYNIKTHQSQLLIFHLTKIFYLIIISSLSLTCGWSFVSGKGKTGRKTGKFLRAKYHRRMQGSSIKLLLHCTHSVRWLNQFFIV